MNHDDLSAAKMDHFEPFGKKNLKTNILLIVTLLIVTIVNNYSLLFSYKVGDIFTQPPVA